jgi:malate dehydrogenase (oxaloacetate-decarboxylating)(NADP+)
MGTIPELGLEFAPEIRTPYDAVSGQYVDDFLAMRGRKGVTRAQAESLMHSRTHYGLMMVKEGDADAFVSGLEHEYPEVIRPALQIFGSAKGVDRAAGVYLTIAKNKVYLFSDPTINIDPDAETLANIAILANDYAMSIDMQPVLGMLSFSNFGSTPHPLSNKVEQAVKIVKERRPDIRVDGPMQADTAVSPALIKERFPFSEIEEANVLIFPDLGSANVAYKLLENLTDAEAIGPILVGIGGPVQLIDSSSEVDDIVTVAAIAAYDAHVRG